MHSGAGGIHFLQSPLFHLVIMKSSAFVQCWDHHVPAIVTCGGISSVFIKSLDTEEHPEFHCVNMLWDTGATASMISKRFVSAHHLTPIGKAKSFTCTGSILVDLYKVNILLPNKIEIENLTVLADELPDTDCLIGMDVINLCDFVITHREGRTKFAFQIPANADIQF